MKSITYKIYSMTVAMLLALNLNATEYDSGFTVDGTDKTVEDGDVYNISKAGSAIAVKNDGSLAIADSGKMTLNLGTPENPLGGSTRGIYVDASNTTSSVKLGNGTTITGYAASGNSYLYGIHTTRGTFSAESGLTVNIQGDGFSVGLVSGGASTINDLGENADIRASYAALNLTGGTTLSAANSYFEGGNVGIGLGMANITLNNSKIVGTDAGISIINSSSFAADENAMGMVNIVGGSIYASNGSAIKSTANSGTSTQYYFNHTVNISDGAKVSSGSGVLFEDADSLADGASSITINVSGTSTSVEGTVSTSNPNHTVGLSIADNATWSSEGASNMDKLVLDNANIELTLDNLGDAINAGEMSTSGDNTILIDFSNDFLNQISDGFVFDTDTAVIIGSGEKDNIEYIVSGSNKNGSTWTVSNNGDGTYTITDINVVPEPAACAAMAGALALALAAYRRRK